MSKKRKIIIGIVVGVALITAGIIVVMVYYRPINRFNRAINAEKIAQAVQIYNESTYNEKYDMSDSILDEIDKYYDAFLNNEITYDDAVDFLNMVVHIDNTDILEKIENIRNRLNVLHESKKSYFAAEKAYREENYAYAYEMYNKVIYEDTFFEAASEGVKASKDEYIEDVLSDVEKYKTESDYLNAINLLEEATGIIGNSTSIEDELDICKSLLASQEIDNTIAEASAYVDAGNIVDAIRVVNDKKQIYSNEKLDSKFVEYCDLYVKSVISNINSLYKKEKYSDAVDVGNKAIGIMGDISGTEGYVENIKNSIKNVYTVWKDGYINSGDYGNAIRVLSDAVKIFPDDKVLNGNRQDCIDTYLENVIAAANSAVDDKDLELATSICDIANEVVGNDERLVKEYEYIDSLYPIYLDELTPVNYDSDMWSKWQYGVTLKDTLGNIYDDYGCAIRLGMYKSTLWDGASQAEYYLGKEYRTISGEIVPEDKTSTEGHCRFVIYADDVCVYRSEPITRKSKKISFTANISDVDFIKIVCEDINSNNSCYFYLINPRLEK